MTIQQRLLALDAALCACEGAIDDSTIRACANTIQTWLEKKWNDELPYFGIFIHTQKDAVDALAASPEVFGAKE